MDSLLENAGTYVNVLETCSSAEVARWKEEDLERAVNWAQYFKRVRAVNNDDVIMTSLVFVGPRTYTE